MISSSSSSLLPASLLVIMVAAAFLAPFTAAQDSDLGEPSYYRPARAPKLIRFGRSGPKLIRFGKRSDPTLESQDAEMSDELSEMIKRAGPKLIRFG